MRAGEKGYTYIELVIAITIAALVTGAATMGVFQILRNTERNNNHVTAAQQVQNAGYWIGRDAQIAQIVVDTDNLTLPDWLELGWTEAISGDEYEVVYTLEDMPGDATKMLLRNESVNGGADVTTMVAQHIDPDSARTHCEYAGGTLSLTITSTVGDGPQQGSETRNYQLAPRPE